MTKIYSWNVNGIRAVYQKGFMDFIQNHQPDILCLQEIKANHDQLPEELANLHNYHAIFNSAEKKGYSGTAIYSKEKPTMVAYEIPELEPQNEGRVITAEFKNFILVNVYTPNSKRQLERLGQRQIWDQGFTNYLNQLQTENPQKAIICCGDLNVAHNEIDLARPQQNTKNAGFTQEERKGIQRHIDNGFIDTFRHLHPDKKNEYTWWSYQAQSRQRNVGWRIDYFLIDKQHANLIQKAEIHQGIHGSDHCPISIQIS